MLKNLFFIIVLVFTLTSCAAINKNSSDVEREKEQLQIALFGFYESLNAMFTGDATKAKEVWSQSENIIYMGANGEYQIGWDNFYADWESQAALRLGGKVAPSNITINVVDNVAYTYQLVKSADPEASGINKEVALRASSVFRKENGDWKMFGHHVDVIPDLTKLYK